jgi:hypothetical protein
MTWFKEGACIGKDPKSNKSQPNFVGTSVVTICFKACIYPVRSAT